MFQKLAVTDNPAAVQQVIGLAAELSSIEIDIFAKENEMNALVDRLYKLSEYDIKLILVILNANGQRSPEASPHHVTNPSRRLPYHHDHSLPAIWDPPARPMEGHVLKSISLQKRPKRGIRPVLDVAARPESS
jgi:hypothetical protein